MNTIANNIADFLKISVRLSFDISELNVAKMQYQVVT
jgi:hypothetical protein